jgi:DnaJ family protein C protein 28
MSENKQQPSRLVFKPQAKAQPKAGPRAGEEERLRAAREKATEYRKPPLSPEEEAARKKEEGIHTIEEWGDLITQRIEEAMRRGDFDNLKGHGKPMLVEPEPNVPEDMQMAFRILRNNDMAPAWIADRKEMLRSIDAWRAEFQRVAAEAHSAWIAAASDERHAQIRKNWERWLARWDGEIVEMNRLIGTFNLKQPIARLEIFKLRLDDELKKVGMARILD